VTERTAPVLWEAIARVLKDEDIRRTAHRIGGNIAGMPIVEKVAERMAALAAGAARTAHSLSVP
jgi:hypothetical protein